MADDQEIIQEEWVFTGQRTHKGVRYYTWANVNNPDELKWYKKPLAPASVGNIYLVHLEGTQIYTGGKLAPSYIGSFKDKDQIVQWAIKDEEAKQILANKSLNTKAAKVEPLEDVLKNIKSISKHLNTTERLAFIAKISEAILRA